MPFCDLQDKIANFYRRVSTKTEYNRETLSLSLTAFASIPCYITKIASSPRNFNKEMTEYTHLIYTDFIESVASTDFIIEVDSKQYEIIEIMDTVNNHHLEFGVNILEDK